MAQNRAVAICRLADNGGNEMNEYDIARIILQSDTKEEFEENLDELEEELKDDSVPVQ
jgi:hypothetical protein